jgi:predicted ATP-grasp superfamily ATP-dependent carboligase
MDKDAVLILDGSQRSALAVVRSLGREGLQVIVADTELNNLASSSKYCVHRETYPHPNNVEDFIATVNRLIDRYRITALYPVSEISVYTLLENKHRLNSVTLSFPSIETVRKLSDKGALVGLCQELGLSVPSSDYFSDGQEFIRNHTGYSYPVVLKPTLSRIKNKEGDWINTSVCYANSKVELHKLIKSTVYFCDYPFMIQEYIEGFGSGVFLLFNEGDYIAHFAHRRLREKPPSGGVSVLSKSIGANPEQLAIAKKLLSEVNWHGVAMVEFKVDDQGKPYVIEVNPRFWGSLQLAIDAGVDFPYMLHQLSTDSKSEKPSYRERQKLRWLLGDLDSLYLVIRDPGYSFRLKLLAVIRFCLPWQPGMRYEVNRLSDMRPFWFEIKNYVKALYRKSV